MRKILYSFVACCGLSLSAVQAQNLDLQWAKAITGTHNVGSNRIVSDQQGNVYTFGNFYGTADFDPGAGVANLTTGVLLSGGGAWFAKYDANGNYVWARQLHDSGDVYINDILVDNNGNVFLTGSFNNTVDIDAGAGVVNVQSAGASDAFVVKYDAGGNYVSSFTLNNNGNSGARGERLLTDASGNLYVAGTFNDTMDLDPGAGVYNVMTQGNNDDIFIAKYASSGAFIQGLTIDVGDLNTFNVDGAGNMLVTGAYTSSFDADPGPGVAMVNTVGGTDGFMAKYDVSGAYVMSFGIDALMLAVDMDANGNIYTTGRVAGTMDLDPGPGVANMVSVNEWDVYLAKYDANGNYIDGRVFESEGVYQCYHLNINHQGNVYLYGNTDTTVDFNPGGSGGVLNDVGERDLFIASFEPNLDFIEAYSLASPTYETWGGMCVDNAGSVWLTGSFTNTLDFDLGAGTSNLTSPLARGSFIARYTDLVAAGVQKISANEQQAKIFAADKHVFVDFSQLNNVDANICVLNLLGQTVLEAEHSDSDVLKLTLPDAAAQFYVVVVNNGKTKTTKKVWVE